MNKRGKERCHVGRLLFKIWKKMRQRLKLINGIWKFKNFRIWFPVIPPLGNRFLLTSQMTWWSCLIFDSLFWIQVTHLVTFSCWPLFLILYDELMIYFISVLSWQSFLNLSWQLILFHSYFEDLFEIRVDLASRFFVILQILFFMLTTFFISELTIFLKFW